MSATVVAIAENFACESEPIRCPGAVQPHGVLLIVEASSGIIEAASASTESLLDRSAESVVGEPLARIVGPAVALSLTPRIDGLQPLVHLAINDQQLSARSFYNDAGQLLVDIESSDQGTAATQALLYACRSGFEALRRFSDIDEIAQEAALLVRRLTGFDRVMIYRFDDDWNGEVIGEARRDSIEAYLGLHFPASDIPKQARELFQSSRMRQIPDAWYVPSALIARRDGQTIDLGQSSLRSISPMHIEYLKSMEVRATLVGSLVVDGRLWGLVSCQQKDTAKYIGPAQRDAIGWLCEDIAALIAVTQLRQRRARERLLTTRRRKLVDAIRAQDFKTLILNGASTDLLDVVGADGFALLIEDEIVMTGVTPEPRRIRELQQQRRTREVDLTLFASNNLGRDLEIADNGDGVAGALFVSVWNKPAITMIWFRRERQYSLRWGGDPNHAHLVDPGGRPSPRKSFAQFLQDVRGQATAWSAEEIDSAADLGALIEIEALRERESFTQTILDSSPENICVLDNQGVIVKVNDSWLQFTEANAARESAATSVGLNYRNICTAATGQPGEAEAGAVWAGIEAVLRKRMDQFTHDYPCGSPCDSPQEQRWFSMRVYQMNAPCEGVVVAHQNVTERKLAEIRVEQEKEKSLALLRNASDGIHILDLAGNVIEISDSFCTALGYCRDEMIGMNVARWDAGFASNEHAKAIAQHSAKQGRSQFETRYRRKGGAIFDVEVSGAPLELDGQPVMFYSSRDITQRKRAEVALASSESQLRNAQRIASLGNWEHARAVNTVLWSDEMFRVYGIERQQTAPTPERLSATIHPDDRSSSEHAYTCAWKNGYAFDLTHRVLTSNGELKYVHVLGEPQFSADGTLLKFVGTAQDVTDRVHQEQSLRVSEARLQSVFGAMAEGLVVQQNDGAIIDANPPAESILGLSRDELLGRVSIDPRWQAVHEDGTPFAGDQHPAMVALRTGQAIRNQIMGVQAPRLGTRWININAQPMFVESAAFADAVVTTFTDITERKLTESRLEYERTQLRTLLATIPDLVWLKSPQGEYLMCNPACANFFGVDETQVVGKTDYDLLPAAVADLFRQDDLAALAGDSPRVREEWVTYASRGRRCLLETTKTIMRDAQGNLMGVLGVAHDITERQHTLDALHENEERFRRAFAQSPAGIALCNLDGYVFKANAAYCRISGYAEDELIGQRLGDLLLSPSAAAEEIEFFRAIASGEIRDFAAQRAQFHKDGRVYIAKNTVSVISDSANHPLYCIAHLEDMTEHQRRQFEALAKQTLQAQEDERKHLSRELHDEIGQSLTALKLMLQRAQRQCGNASAQNCLQEATEATGTLMDSVRGIAYRLRPSQLDDLGLMASLRWHMDKIIRPTGVPYALVGNVDETRFPADIELCCFRVVQEALNNVMKHARATRIEVNLYRTENALALQVRDEGIGFDVSEGLLAPESIGSLGLIGMRERVAATGGQLQIHSMPGQGTEIDANFPLPPSRQFS